jgi:hypothetical protein
MIRRGFKPSNYLLYDLAKNDVDDYLPDDMWSRLCDTNGRLGIHILGSKLLFHHTFEHDLKLARLYGHISRGLFTPRHPHQGSAARDLPSLLLEVGSVVVKPVDGQKGKRVHVLAASQAGAIELDGRRLSPSEFATWLKSQDCMLVHDRVQQASYASTIFPGSANTIRIVTVTDADGPFVLSGGHRFGRVGSAPVDNFAAGGLLCSIDLAAGTLGQGASQPGPGERHLVWHAAHPETGAQIEGQVVPGIFDLIELLLTTCRRHPYLAYVGWDVVMTDQGPVVLEANYGSGLQLQLYGGFLLNERFARFVKAVRADARRER